MEYFCGVPDSLLKDFCAYVTAVTPKSHHVITANEGQAIALAAGYHMATGKAGVVYLQVRMINFIANNISTIWMVNLSPNSWSTTNFSFQFIASYVRYSMENLVGDLSLGLKFVLLPILLLMFYTNNLSAVDYVGLMRLCRILRTQLLIYFVLDRLGEWRFRYLGVNGEGILLEVKANLVYLVLRQRLRKDGVCVASLWTAMAFANYNLLIYTNVLKTSNFISLDKVSLI